MLFTFYIQGVLKLKKKSGAKRLRKIVRNSINKFDFLEVHIFCQWGATVNARSGRHIHLATLQLHEPALRPFHLHTCINLMMEAEGISMKFYTAKIEGILWKSFTLYFVTRVGSPHLCYILLRSSLNILTGARSVSWN